MKLAAFTLIDSVMTRWAENLSENDVFLKVGSISELKTLYSGNEIYLFLIHRSIADKAVIGRLCSLPTSQKIFVFSDQPSNEEGLFFVKKGAVGYANTNISSVLLNQAVEVVSSGRVWIGHKLMDALIRSLGSVKKDIGESTVLKSEKTVLTNRENDISRFIAKGFTNIEIANVLSISERTVKAHLSSIYKKTNTHGRLQLALMLQRHAL